MLPSVSNCLLACAARSGPFVGFGTLAMHSVGKMCVLTTEAKTAVREVFVLNLRIMVHGDTAAEDIFLHPVVLASQNASTILSAIMRALVSQGLDLQEVAAKFQTVVWIFGIDGASTNELIHNFLRSRVPGNVIALRSTCMLHASNRITSDHLHRSGWNLVNPLYSMILLLQLGRIFESFVSAVMDLVEIHRIEWYPGLDPDPSIVEKHDRLLKFYCPHMCKRDGWREMQHGCRFWNTDWQGRPGSGFAAIH
jgi:hypothetical protein